MRTTIDLDGSQRGQLLEIAARRGLKGFSMLIQEAVDAWLRDQVDADSARRRAAALAGSLAEGEAADLHTSAAQARHAVVPRSWE